MSTEATPDCIYLSLRDAKKSPNKKINLMVKVSEIRKVLKSRGSGYVLTLKVFDESELNPGIFVNFFADNLNRLPQVKSVGDILSVHHVEIKVNEGEWYCTSNLKLSSFALFNGGNVLNLSPYQTSVNYQPAPHDEKLFLKLRTISQIQHDKVSAAADEPLSLFCNIVSEEKHTIVCKVLHIAETSDADLVLFVWDGTDSPLVTLRSDLNIEGDMNDPMGPLVSLLSREILYTFPRVGTIVRIIVTKSFEDVSPLKGVGYWVKLCNVVFETQLGLWKGFLDPSGTIDILSNEDDNVQWRQRIYDNRISSKVHRLPSSSFPWPSDITDTDYAFTSYSTLMESLAYPEVVHKCRTVVRVVSSYPWQAKDLRSPESGLYRLRLTIEDSTARIHAYIFGEDGEKFFGGYLPNCLLTEKMNRLLGIRDGGCSGAVLRNPPWIWCCLKSYFLDKNDPWGSRRYRIFGTTLFG